MRPGGVTALDMEQAGAHWANGQLAAFLLFVFCIAPQIRSRPASVEKFVERYRRELRPPAPREGLHDLARRAAESAVTVVYRSRDQQHGDSAVIRDAIARRLRTRSARSARRRLSEERPYRVTPVPTVR